MAVTNALTTMIMRRRSWQEYLAWGTLTLVVIHLIASSGTTPNSYRFTGEQLDGNLGLCYLRARLNNRVGARHRHSRATSISMKARKDFPP